MNTLDGYFNILNERIVSHTQLAPLLEERYQSYTLVVFLKHNKEVLKILANKSYLIEESSYYDRIVGEPCVKYQVFVFKPDPDIEKIINENEHFFYQNETRLSVIKLIYSIRYNKNKKSIVHILELLKEDAINKLNLYSLFDSIFRENIDFDFNNYFKELGESSCRDILNSFSQYNQNIDNRSIQHLAIILKIFPRLQESIKFKNNIKNKLLSYLL